MSHKINIYFGVIILMLSFAIIAGGLILVFIRYQKRLLFKQRELHQLDSQHKQDLLSNSIQSAENERMRIAKDIHDEIGSIFSTLSLSLDQMKQVHDIHADQFYTSKGLIQSGINSVRRISHAIVPFELELLGLQQTLENHFDTISSVSEINVNFKCQYSLELLNNTSSLSIYRIVQELVSNCMKYAQAQNIDFEIATETDKNNLILTYSDDGVGMDMGKHIVNKGIGLKNIEGRVLLLNGMSTINSAPGKGFFCKIIIPLNKNTTV